MDTSYDWILNRHHGLNKRGHKAFNIYSFNIKTPKQIPPKNRPPNLADDFQLLSVREQSQVKQRSNKTVNKHFTTKKVTESYLEDRNKYTLNMWSHKHDHLDTTDFSFSETPPYLYPGHHRTDNPIANRKSSGMNRSESNPLANWSHKYDHLDNTDFVSSVTPPYLYPGNNRTDTSITNKKSAGINMSESRYLTMLKPNKNNPVLQSRYTSIPDVIEDSSKAPSYLYPGHHRTDTSITNKKSGENRKESNPLTMIKPNKNKPALQSRYISIPDIIEDDDNTCNATSCTHAPSFQPSTLIKGVVLCVIATMSFVANVATLASILRKQRRQQATSTIYLLMCQLTAADLLVTLFCILAEALWTLTVQWRGGWVLCKLVKFAQMFSLYLSTYVLVLIGFDRLWAIRYPMRRQSARVNVKRGIVLIWVLSGLFSMPQVAIFRVRRGPFIEDFYQCVTYGFYNALWQEQLYTTLTLVLMFVLPLLVISATYLTTFVTIQDSGRTTILTELTFRSPVGDARHKLLHKAKIKSLTMTVVIVLTFMVCWTPYYVMMVIFMFLEPDEQLGKNLQDVIFFFGSSTSLLNPIIYGAFHLSPRTNSRRPPNLLYNSYSCRGDNSMFGKTPSPRRANTTYLHMNEDPKTGSGVVIDRDDLNQKSTSLLNPIIYGAFHLSPPTNSRRPRNLLYNSCSCRGDNSAFGRTPSPRRANTTYLHMNGNKRTSVVIDRVDLDERRSMWSV
ncbi:hypothetical protein JTE90_013038 [Oedothorax gibbosus]|uniref:G-protein coupled receptors family 1 profile domain-containing protein n=1 Tax=Oedothorax gibbosus TaxID=931172 RepID=A0AAV6UH12_9ARAC|nr:hypothetical protein JTE90_013038 [Oedothorax gibbosus]